MDTQFAVDAFQVGANGFDAEPEARPDLLVAVARRHLRQNLRFPRTQPGLGRGVETLNGAPSTGPVPLSWVRSATRQNSTWLWEAFEVADRESPGASGWKRLRGTNDDVELRRTAFRFANP